MLFMLKKNWPGDFQRTIRDDKGNVSRVIKFTPGEPVEVTKKSEIKILEKDLGFALLEVELDEKGRSRPIEVAPATPESNPPEAISEVESAVPDAMTEAPVRRGGK